MNFRQLKGLVGRSVSAWIDDFAPSMGAALAYYTLFSIAPLHSELLRGGHAKQPIESLNLDRTGANQHQHRRGQQRGGFVHIPL